MKASKAICDNYKKIIRMLWSVGKGSIIFIWISTVIAGLIPTISTILMQDIINLIQSSEKDIKYLIVLFISYILCDIVLSIIGIRSNYVSMIFQQKLSLEIDTMILNKINTLGIQDFEISESYNKLQRAKAQSGIQVFNYFSHITTIIRSAVMVIGSIFILLSWNIWSIAVVSVIASVNMILLLKLNKYQYEVLRKRTGEEREKWYYQYILTNDIAFKEIKTYGLHRFFKDKYIRIAEKFISQDKQISKTNAHIGELKTLLEQIGNTFILGKIFLDTFYGKILIGNTIAYIRCVSSIKTNINSLFMETVSIYKESLYMSQLFEFLDMQSSEHTSNSKEVITSIRDINILNLSYKYKNSAHYVLKNISMTIKGNEKLNIVGKNGSGKSTLVKVIAGFYDDYEGDIFINGVNFHDINKEFYRKKIGILFQDYNKYELNIRENVGVGNLDSLHEDEQIIQALKNASAPEKLSANLNNQIGCWFHDGFQLSGGEWLRIGISRIFLRDADLYILDEPNAALDPIGELSILQSIKKLLSHKMSITITHHINNIEKMPGNIIVMNEGTIIDSGSHRELLDQCPLYEELYRKSVDIDI